MGWSLRRTLFDYSRPKRSENRVGGGEGRRVGGEGGNGMCLPVRTVAIKKGLSLYRLREQAKNK